MDKCEIRILLDLVRGIREEIDNLWDKTIELENRLEEALNK